MDRRALLHFFFEHFGNHARVSLAARFFHNLANEEADSFILTGLVVSNGLRVLSNGFLNQLEDSAFITNLLQTELLNESLRSFVLFEHFGKYLFSQLAGQHSVFNQVNQLC